MPGIASRFERGVGPVQERKTAFLDFIRRGRPAPALMPGLLLITVENLTGVLRPEGHIRSARGGGERCPVPLLGQ